jgi:hypothetical protein
LRVLRANLRERGTERRIVQIKSSAGHVFPMSPGSAAIEVFPQQRIVFVSHRDELSNPSAKRNGRKCARSGL